MQRAFDRPLTPDEDFDLIVKANFKGSGSLRFSWRSDDNEELMSFGLKSTDDQKLEFALAKKAVTKEQWLYNTTMEFMPQVDLVFKWRPSEGAFDIDQAGSVLGGF